MRTKVIEMRTPGNGIATNQYIIETPIGRYFQSYSTTICKIDLEGKVTLDIMTWNCSQTTGKYRDQFLGESKKDTQKKIDSGEYILTDLNM